MTAKTGTRICTRVGIVGLFGLAYLSTAAAAHAATSGMNGTHDPSRMIESEGKLYFFSTGGNGKSSPDGLAWSNGSPLFPNGFPSWVATLLVDNQGLWAPDVIYLNHQYYVYYSVAARSSKACAIGLITSPTLNPSSPNYKWTDRGVVVSSSATVSHSTIDPAPILDNDNNLWLVWGGGYPFPTTAESIFLTRLDNTTGLPSSADPVKPGHAIELGHKEGPYLQYHGGNYYLFWQTGGCCSGAGSTYTINMARSPSITGPFAGDRVFLKGHDSIHGPGHMGIYHACGVERFTYHYYPDTGGSVLGENELTWGADGWPVAGPESTSAIKPCGEIASDGDGGAVGTGGAGGAGGAGGSNNPGGAGGTASGSVDSDGGGTPDNGSAGSGGASEPVGVVPGGQSGSSGISPGGNVGASPAGAESDAGCACSFPQSRGRTRAALLIAAAGAALAVKRGRRKR